MSEQHELAIVFDGPPGAVSGRFVEVELDGKGISFGKWLEWAAGIWKLILPEPYAQLAALRQIVDKWDSELASVDEIAGHAALLLVGDLRSLIDDIQEISDSELSDQLGQFLLPLLKYGILSVTDIQEGHDIQRQLWGLEASERAAVIRMNDAEDAMARMRRKYEQT